MPKAKLYDGDTLLGIVDCTLSPANNPTGGTIIVPSALSLSNYASLTLEVAPDAQYTIQLGSHGLGPLPDRVPFKIIG